MTAPSTGTSAHRFGLFCVACFLLSIAYGATFLLSLLVRSFGASEREAGQVFAVAMVSTLIAVLGSGHVLQRLGAPRCIALGAVCLVIASAGFAVVPGLGIGLSACGFILGVGWGLFYTVGPIMVAAMVEPSRRTHCFALLSGSMLSGIGSGPLLGKLAGFAGLPVQTAFAFAAVAAVLGGWYFWRLGAREETRMRSNERVQISLKATAQVMRSPSGLSILMVGLGGAVFGVMGSFQTSYATSLGLDYSLFFIGFMGAAIVCRLLIAKWVVQRNPFLASCVLTSLMLIAVIGFGEWVHDSLGYLLTAALLGVGYGLNYSVINGLAANEAPPGLTAQALLLFSLSYFMGVFGFPFIAGKLISHTGVAGMLLGVGLVAALVWVVSVGRWLFWRFTRTERVAR
ncbi:Predicted arabinose efflux permease, MFS family [Pseudomonas asplenii]|uniref:Predicted arabinose efflux permease, MFS family n=1 Tax=Pseudomonas asplenii TaxID=53407 RepID=A0A1H1XZY1_9PSED|nr:MFS transporter [Pseudomonas asplenii]SDT14732.1 Predicted arabinose efflux permease, MFS family [Pseudomonas asplenii]